LEGIGVAGNTQVGDDNQWVLNNFRQTLISGNGVSVSEEEQSRTVNNLNADLLELAVIRTSSLDGAELYRYVQYLRSNGLDSQRYEIAFWSRIASTAGIAVMCVLALPFVFGTLRASGAGTRMLIGILIGLGYFLLSRTMADSGEVYDLHPVLVAWAPTLLLSGVTVLAISRVR
jgi:lipopolysaccharide export system permease protein